MMKKLLAHSDPLFSRSLLNTVTNPEAAHPPRGVCLWIWAEEPHDENTKNMIGMRKAASPGIDRVLLGANRAACSFCPNRKAQGATHFSGGHSTSNFELQTSNYRRSEGLSTV
jgi:hypothetical protein